MQTKENLTGTPAATGTHDPEPPVPFAAALLDCEPPRATFNRAARHLEPGKSVAFRKDFMTDKAIERAIQALGKLGEELQLRREPGRIILTRAPADDTAASGKSVAKRLLEMTVGQSIDIKGPRVSTVRSTASQLSKIDQPRHYSVMEIGKDHSRIFRGEPGATERNRWSRYQFGQIGPGGQFTLAQNEHTSIESMRALCTYHGKKRRLVFQARENIDGSVTIRCYAVGGLPPKWAIDKDHARIQERITAEQAVAPGDAGGQQDAAGHHGCVD